MKNFHKIFVAGLVMVSLTSLALVPCCCVIDTAHAAINETRSCCKTVSGTRVQIQKHIGTVHDCQACGRENSFAVVDEKKPKNFSLPVVNSGVFQHPVDAAAGGGHVVRFAQYSQFPPIQSLQESVPIYLFIRVLRL